MSMPDPPSARARSDSSTPRRRSSDPAPRRRETDHKPAKGRFGAFLTVAVGVLFLGYVFNIAGFAVSADRFFNSLNSSAQSEGETAAHVVSLLYPVLALLFVSLVMFAILRWVMDGMKQATKRRKLAGREVITLEAFKRTTEARGIRPRIATQAYHLMLPYYQSSMRARMDDCLVDDLHMTPMQVQDVYANLLRNTDRKAPVGETPSLLSILDLLNAVQNAKRQSLMDSVMRPAARLSGMVRARKHPDAIEKDAVLH